MHSLIVMFISALHLVGATSVVEPMAPDDGSNILPGHYIIELDAESQFQRSFRLPHTKLYRHLERRGASWNLKKEYNGKFFTGAAVELESDDDLSKLEEAPGVLSITPVYTYPAPELASTQLSHVARGLELSGTNIYNLEATGVDKLHAEGYAGKGITIGIIDTGIDYTHPALGGGFGPGNKVVGGYDFVGDWYTGLRGSPPPAPDHDPLSECNGHGTAVAGVVGANPTHSPYDFVGVAYEASINAYRVFGCEGRTNDMVIIEALNRADRDGNDIINISIGPEKDTWGKSAARVVASRMVERGRIIVFAAGNESLDGPWFVAAGRRALSVANAKISPSNSSINDLSSWGPSNDMFMDPSISAPGTDVLVTFPLSKNSYSLRSGTALAAPFVAGSMALVLQIRGKNITAETIHAILQNTANPIPGREGLIEPASHQGAGLIQVYHAARSTASMLPAELLLNDTACYHETHEIVIRNDGRNTVTYDFQHVAAGAVMTVDAKSHGTFDGSELRLSSHSASISISSSNVTVPASQSSAVTINIQPPMGLDARQFPIFSGYIIAKGSDGSTLRSTYLGLAAALKDMQIFSSVQPPVIRDQHNRTVGPYKKFTMFGTDYPTLYFKLAAGTPRLSVDLIPLHEMSNISDLFTKHKAGEPLRNIFRALYVSRDSSSGSRAVKINRFSNDARIPSGMYQIVLRALKITGDPTNEQDWELWLSPVLVIRSRLRG